MSVTPHASVEEFFHQVLTEALDTKAVEASEHAEHYLVTLLGEFTKQRITDEPLSLKLAEASEPLERVKALKEVGDTTLYVTGFFSESLGRKLVGPDYYVHLGKAAYTELSERLASSRAARVVYRELAANFPSFVEVLAEVSYKVNFVGSDVGKLYEKWLETRSEWIEHRLRSLGMMLPSSPDAEDLH